VLDILFRYVVAERMGTIILSVIVGHTAWHWMGDRFEILRQFPWPTITAAGVASALRWAMALVGIAAALWLVSVLAARISSSQPEAEALALEKARTRG
ncbi:MAG: hypothetical protein KGO48_11975, partial [Alphaproteobacteria bacterium]|nr:hypothetical protein [Alphaproteobacteria bacterium]